MDKPRVMYVVECYPAITETYIQSEIDALRDEYEIRILALQQAEHPNQSPHPAFEIADPARMHAAIEEFRPHVLHTHWLVHVPLLGDLARRTGVPFTVRAHSFDGIWNETEAIPAQILDVSAILNSDLCLGVLGFPFMRENFERAGVRHEKIFASYPILNYDRFLDRSANGAAVMTGGAGRAPKQMEDFLDLAAGLPGVEFNLYAIGHHVEKLRRLNSLAGNRVNIRQPVQPFLMPGEYKNHRWLVETASLEVNARGWPIMVAEAQASGVGVCMRNIRSDLQEYVGDCGFLYDSIEEVREIISQPFPEEMRQLGFEHAGRSDIRRHKHVLTGLWQTAITKPRAEAPRPASQTPAVTIILPTFNRAATLKRSIDSVLSQTFGDFELIIVDDGSTDETSEVLEAFRNHPRIRLVSQSRQGVAKARNVGIALARGRYIAFQDSDDEWLPHKLERSIKTLEALGPDTGVFYSDMLRIRTDRSGLYLPSPEVQPGLLIDEESLDYQVAGIGIVSALIRRECFDRIGMFDEKLARFSDLELLIRLSDHFQFVRCQEPLVKYYAGDGISTDREALISARRYLMEKYRDRLEQNQHHLLSQKLHLKIDADADQIEKLASELARTRAVLDTLTSSRSWRLIQLYSRIKNHHLLRAPRSLISKRTKRKGSDFQSRKG
jgi:glycosyltransferase involved in cell wall biosynthesis